MFSVMLLMGVLVGAAWVCGLRKIDTEKLINVNIDEHFHYVSVRGKKCKHNVDTLQYIVVSI